MWPTETRSRSESPSPDASPEVAVEASQRAREHLLSLQRGDGHWCAELEGDSILASEYALTLIAIGMADDPRIPRLLEQLRRTARPAGGWAAYPGGPCEASSSVKAYFVLKLHGEPAAGPLLRRARAAILTAGGLDACNSFTKIYLAIFGQVAWSECPAVPPEVVMQPRWSPFDIYEMSSWSRAMVVPLSILWACKPEVAVASEHAIDELRCGAPQRPTLDGWERAFRVLDRLIKRFDSGAGPQASRLRRRALERAERWILERLEASDGLAAIFPAVINTLIALRCRGYGLEQPLVQSQLRELEKLEIAEDDALRVQPCLSPVWDTGLALHALQETDLAADDERLQRAARWLLDKEVRRLGDWAVKVRDVEPSGWYFEYQNEFYPDCDDTAAVLGCLARVRFSRPDDDQRRRAALARGTRWLLAMQNPDGGWGAFDRGCDRQLLTKVPFADHNAMLDPSWEDITGRVLEALAELGQPADHPLVRRAVGFLLSKQEADGTWYGRWGCNYIYGTWLALSGLHAVGEDLSQPRFQRALDWLEARQNGDGGWGELPRSYDEPETKGCGPSTAAQTAWALDTLTLARRGDSLAAAGGVDYLLRTQLPSGAWQDEHWTGTGFPRVFYLRYHLYATYFPLRALTAWSLDRRS